MNLPRRTALVTGGASGIGAAVASRLEASGYAVVRADIAKGAGVHQLDVASESSWTELVGLVEAGGPIDVLVNVAGTTAPAALAETTLAEWNRVIHVNQTGTFLGIRTVLPGMLRRQSGSIVNVASIFSTQAVEGIAAYHASKAAVIGLTRNAAVTYARSGIRVNAVAPGWIATPMTSVQDEETKSEYIDATPLGRGGQPEEVAAAIAFLAGDEASFITGAVLPVDGGYLAR